MFEITSKVLCSDGTPAGQLQYLVLDPQGDVSDLIVSLEGDPGSRIVSVADVGFVKPGEITLNVSLDEVRRRRAFRREEMLVPAEEALGASYHPDTVFMWMNPYHGANVGAVPPSRPMAKVQVDHGVGDRFTLVGRDTAVRTRGGKRIGTVDHLVVDPGTYQPQQVVVRMPGIRRRRVLVPIASVSDWERDAVVVDLTLDDVKALPPFTSHRPDADIARDVREALRSAAVHPRGLEVECRDGHVALRGHVADDEGRRTADRVARAAPGVLSLANGLTTDRMLEARVHGRLYDDPVASLYPLSVDVLGGRVTVRGLVPNVAVRHVVREAAEGTPGITELVDELTEDATAFAGEPAVATIRR